MGNYWRNKINKMTIVEINTLRYFVECAILGVLISISKKL